jgi:hypothetical protein
VWHADLKRHLKTNHVHKSLKRRDAIQQTEGYTPPLTCCYLLNMCYEKKEKKNEKQEEEKKVDAASI